MSGEREKLLKEIRDKEKKMTRVATARIINKKNDSSYSPILTGNQLNDSYANRDWAYYVFEVDGKTYSGYDIVHPLQRTCKILYNPDDPSQNRTKYARTSKILRSPVFILLLVILIPVAMILLLRIFGITFW